MGKSDSCGGSRFTIQHTRLVLCLVTSLLHQQPRIIDFFHYWEVLLLNFMITLGKSKDVYSNVKDSCDGSGLNTNESSKDSRP